MLLWDLLEQFPGSVMEDVLRPALVSRGQVQLGSPQIVAAGPVLVCSFSRPVSCCLLVVLDKERFTTLN